MFAKSNFGLGHKTQITLAFYVCANISAKIIANVALTT